MPGYKSTEKAVYEQMKLFAQETGTGFSLRQKGSKGAERDYFIGTINSNYFGFTLWEIPLAYPGASSDLMNFIFKRDTNDRGWNFKFQLRFTREAVGLQNELCIKFSDFIKDTFLELERENQWSCYTSNDDNRSIHMDIKLQREWFQTVEELLESFEGFLKIISDKINSKINEFKSIEPKWKCAAISLDLLETYETKMQKRFDKYRVVTPTVDFESVSSAGDEAMDEESEELFYCDQPLNQILYGPPGTGKTWNTINHAVAICEGVSVKNIKAEASSPSGRSSVKKRYDQFVQNGQIMFTTFHQSMSYEDFVEGIKPSLDGESLGYQIQYGIFGQAVMKAASYYTDSTSGIKLTFDSMYRLYLENIKAQIDEGNDYLVYQMQGQPLSIKNITSNDGIQMVKPGSTRKAGIPSHTKEKIKKVYSEYAETDLPYPKELRKLIGSNSGGSGLYAIVNDLKKFVADLPQGEIESDEDNFNFDSLNLTELLSYVDDTSKPPVVLIIDEINRGNVSAIFGELITLLEDDKRLGEENEIRLTLPYSKAEFGVPSNLFVLGTMNTADRSVEALDTALRRRFSFIEMMPDVKILAEDIEGINLNKLLKTINQRLEFLVGRDHTIGHAFFINLETREQIIDVFKNKVIPQLQEYFYGDWEKIQLVLGKKFVQRRVEQISSSKLWPQGVHFDGESISQFEITDESEWVLESIYSDVE